MVPEKVRGTITADKQLIERAEQALYEMYNRSPVVFNHREGVKPYDTERNEYLDFGTDIAVMTLGHGDEEYIKAVEEQPHKLTHTSNLSYNRPSIEAGGKLLQVSHMDEVFFTNSSTEAIEGVLKIVKRYHYNKLYEIMGGGCDGCEDVEPDMIREIIAMNHSFHGGSLDAPSVTGSAHYQESLKSLMPGIRSVDFDNLDSTKKLINSKTCATTMKTIQEEEGVYLIMEEFIKGVRALCDEHDLLLILDEIRCGMGHFGEMFTWQHYDVKPDVVIAARTLGNGPPVSAFLAWGKVASVMVPGDHGTTYGGNPLVTAGVSVVLDIFEKYRITEHVKGIGIYLYEELGELSKELGCIRAHRGIGLIQGLKFSALVDLIVSKALLGQKLVLTSAGTSIIRFVPLLVIEKADVDEMMRRLRVATAE